LKRRLRTATCWRTLDDIEERQRIASAQGDDTDVLAYYAEPPLVAANLFHLRAGRVVTAATFTGKTWRSSIRTNLCIAFETTLS